MGERIKDKMHRLYREYQREPQETAAPTATTSASASDSVTVSRAPVSRENIDASASPDELRRARTHRLIQVGAICDQYLGTRGMTPEQVITYLSHISMLESVQEIISDWRV